jgi:hypothetical protein
VRRSPQAEGGELRRLVRARQYAVIIRTTPSRRAPEIDPGVALLLSHEHLAAPRRISTS